MADRFMSRLIKVNNAELAGVSGIHHDANIAASQVFGRDAFQHIFKMLTFRMKHLEDGLALNRRDGLLSLEPEVVPTELIGAKFKCTGIGQATARKEVSKTSEHTVGEHGHVVTGKHGFRIEPEILTKSV
jgi:hypothetical protein